jgi:hypothetical protein
MVTRIDTVTCVDAGETVTISIDSTCINAARPIPTGKDRFRGAAKASRKLILFLDSAQYEDSMVIQAGVWAITDNYSKKDIQSKLVLSPSSYRSGPAVSDAQIARAKQILDGLEIRNRL